MRKEIFVELKRLKSWVRNDRATSPTIGSILLVGVTVALATTAGVHTLSFTDAQQKPFAVASVEYDTANDSVTVLWKSNTNADNLRVTVTVAGEHRTSTLNSVGHSLVVDEDGITVHKDGVHRWEEPSATDGDEVTVTVLAVKDEQTVVIAERTETL